MLILKKSIIPLFIFNLLNSPLQAKWHAQIIGINEDTIRIFVSHDNYDRLTYEINSKDAILNDSVLEVNKNEINDNSLHIVVCGEEERLYLELKYNGNNNIIVTENEYYLGYYLITYNSNCIIYNSNFANKITFYNYDKEVSFPNISYFNDAFLPKFSLYYKGVDVFFESELFIQIPNQTFINLPYNFIGYSFKYDINQIESYYYFALSKTYSLDFVSNTIYYSNINTIPQIIFPMNFSNLDFNIFLFLKYDQLNFIFPYHVHFERNVYKEIDIIETNNYVEYEENIDLI